MDINRHTNIIFWMTPTSQEYSNILPSTTRASEGDPNFCTTSPVHQHNKIWIWNIRRFRWSTVMPYISHRQDKVTTVTKVTLMTCQTKLLQWTLRNAQFWWQPINTFLYDCVACHVAFVASRASMEEETFRRGGESKYWKLNPYLDSNWI